MKNITAIGYLTNDCEVIEKEKQSVRFSIAVDDGYGDNKGTIFFSVSYFRAGLAQYLVKGKLVAVSGDLKRNDYEGKTYLNIWANEVKLLGGKNKENTDNNRYSEGQTIEANENIGDFDDEIPWK